MEDVMVVGAALKPDLGRVSLRRIPNNPGVQGMLFETVAKAGILVDDIVQTEFGEIASISFTVDHSELADVKIAASQVLDRVGTGELAIEIGLAKVSVVGTGMKTHVGVASRMFTEADNAYLETKVLSLLRDRRWEDAEAFVSGIVDNIVGRITKTGELMTHELARSTSDLMSLTTAHEALGSAVRHLFAAFDLRRKYEARVAEIILGLKQKRSQKSKIVALT